MRINLSKAHFLSDVNKWFETEAHTCLYDVFLTSDFWAPRKPSMHTIYRTTEDKVGFFIALQRRSFIYSGLLDTILRYLRVAISSHWSNVRKIVILLSEVPQGREAYDRLLLPFATGHRRRRFRVEKHCGPVREAWWALQQSAPPCSTESFWSAAIHTKMCCCLNPQKKKENNKSCFKNGPWAGLLPCRTSRTTCQRGSQSPGLGGAGSQCRRSRGPLLPRTQGKNPLSGVASVALSKCTVGAFYLSKNNTLAVSG